MSGRGLEQKYTVSGGAAQWPSGSSLSSFSTSKSTSFSRLSGLNVMSCIRRSKFRLIFYFKLNVINDKRARFI